MKKYVKRTVEKELLMAAREFPVVILTGARQTGKSTLLKHIFKKYSYVTLDYPDIRKFAKEDPALFFEKYNSPLIIDEIQYAPELLEYIKIIVDNNRNKNGQFILTGSQHFNLMKGVSESLAGRASIHNLLGLSLEELKVSSEKLNLNITFDSIFKGFYPDVAIHNVRNSTYYASYLQTYLDRDIRQILSVQDLSVFHNYLELLAARVGSILNLNEMSKKCGISFPTAKRWLSLLEATQIIYLLRPYYKNISKRVIKSPKLYFYDTGLLAYILKYQSSEMLQSGPLAGIFFENLIIIELLKKKVNKGYNYALYYFRDSNKNEVDVIIEYNGVFQLIEIKMAKTMKKAFATTLKKIAPLIPNSHASVISFNRNNLPLSKNISSLFWYDFIKKIGELKL